MNTLSVGRKSKIEILSASAVWPYLQLARPANLITAMADILAGYAVAGMPSLEVLFWLLISTIGLYGGGVVLNDVFDARLDAVERPERPIPAGRVPSFRAALLGSLLLLIGVAAGFQAGPISGLISLSIAFFALLYDAWGKTEPVVGSIGMGACRGLNLLLGMSAAPPLLSRNWLLASVAFFYITAVTILSKGEVSGGRPGQSRGPLVLLALAMLSLVLLALRPPGGRAAFFPFLFLLALRVVPPFWRAALKPEPGPIRAAVKAGVLSLIILDAAIAAGHAGFFYGLALLSLSLLAGPLARVFAVT